MRFFQSLTQKSWVQYSVTVILALASALTYEIFVFPNDFAPAGLNGLATMVQYLFHVDVGFMALLINIPMLIAAFFIVKRRYTMRTLTFVVAFSVSNILFQQLDLSNTAIVFDAVDGGGAILAAVAGGFFYGVFYSVAMRMGGSTGGVDIIAFTLCKIFKRWKSSAVIFAIDAAVVVLGMFVIGDFVLTLLGVFSAFVSAVMVDKVFLGGSRGYIAHIVTDKYTEINAGVIERLERTTTILDVIGGYSGEGKKMVMVSFTMSQYAELVNIINKNDKNAFVTVHRAHEINGEGWTR